MMKTAVVCALLVCAAFAAPVEDLKAAEAAEETPEEQVVVVADTVVEAPEDEMAVAEARSDICPTGWLFHGSRCFLFVNNLKSWFRAEEHCTSLGAHLASATNPTEYSFLQQMTRDMGQSHAWIGGFYLQGRWFWVGRQEMYYHNWSNQLSGFTSYSCIYLLTTSSGWGNHSCSNNYRYICSKSPFSH